MHSHDTRIIAVGFFIPVNHFISFNYWDDEIIYAISMPEFNIKFSFIISMIFWHEFCFCRNIDNHDEISTMEAYFVPAY
jgi:hypothetical protein